MPFPRILKHPCTAVAIIASTRISSAAEAQTGTTIEWETVPGCPTRAEVIDQVQRYLGQPVGVSREQSLVVRARVERRESGEYSVILVTEGSSGHGQRDFPMPIAESSRKLHHW